MVWTGGWMDVNVNYILSTQAQISSILWRTILKKKVVFPLFDFFPLQRSTAFEMDILERIKQICGLVQNVSLLFETFPLLILML